MRLSLMILSGVAAMVVAGCGGSTVAVIEDPGGYSCKADEARYGRCPENKYFGDSRKEVAAAKKREQMRASSPLISDPEDYACRAYEAKYGRCPYNPLFGLTKAQVRTKKAQEAAARREAARRAREAEARRNAWKQGFDEYSDGIAYKWDNSVCDNSYFSCFGMRLVTRDGCDSLYVELQIKDSAGNAVDYTNATASHLTPGQVALLDFSNTSDRGDTASIAEVNCY